jgi:hypothetical protein
MPYNSKKRKRQSKNNSGKNNRTRSSRRLPKKYVPNSLTSADKKKQINSILKGKDRPKVNSFKSKRSSWVVKFENKYGYKITDKQKISQNILARPGIEKILEKGRGAYYSGGSRPNQTPHSWANARLASVILGGNARKVDINIWNMYKKI